MPRGTRCRTSDLPALRVPPEEVAGAGRGQLERGVLLRLLQRRCSYYKEGWEWMKQQFNQMASYRYVVNPATGASSPLPVWSDSATREMIVEDDRRR